MQKDHKCDCCGKSFSEAGSMNKHINSVHNGQKDYKCDSCGKSLSTAGNLKIHINSVHNGQIAKTTNVTIVANCLIKVDNKNDENVHQLGSITEKRVWNPHINVLFSEFIALKAKFSDQIKKECVITARYFEEKQEMIQYWLINWSVEKINEKLLTYLDGCLKELKRFLVIRGISSRNQ